MVTKTPLSVISLFIICLMSVNNINDLLTIVNELSYEEAVSLTKNLPAPTSLTEKK